jgi:hypothetical protein
MATKFQKEFYFNSYVIWSYGEFWDEILGNFGLNSLWQMKWKIFYLKIFEG